MATKTRMSWSEKRYYIKQIWEHHHKSLSNPERFISTSRSDCIRGTLAILLGRWKEQLLDFDWYYTHEWFDPENHTIAWFDFGKYETDYGTGTSWSYLVVGPRLTFTIGNDGSL